VPDQLRSRLAGIFGTWDMVRLAPYYSMFFLWSLGTGAQFLARPLFASQLGASTFLVVLITASNAISSLIAGPITGFMADRFGRKPMVLMGNAIRGATLVGEFFVHSYWPFFVLEFIGTLGVAMFVTSSQVAMGDLSTVENRGRLLALRTMTQRLGTILGPAVGAAVIVPFDGDLRYMFLFNAVTKIVIHVLVSYGAQETAPEGVVGKRGRPGEPAKRKLDLSFFRTRAFLALMITAFALNMMAQNGAYGALFPVIARDQAGLDKSAIANLMTLAGFIGLLLSYPNGWAIDRFGRKVTLIPGLIILAISAVLLARMDNAGSALVMSGFFGVGSIMSLGASQAFAVDLAPPDQRGAFLGMWGMVSNLGSVLASLFIGAIASTLGYGFGFSVVAGMLLVSALFMKVFGPETGARARAPVASSVP